MSSTAATLITIYDAASGAIHSVRSVKTLAEADAAVAGPEGWAWTLGAHDGARSRIDPATRMPLPLRRFDLTVEPFRLSGIPAGAEAFLLGRRLTVDDGELVLEPDLGLDQAVTVKLMHPLYEPEKVTVPCPA